MALARLRMQAEAAMSAEDMLAIDSIINGVVRVNTRVKRDHDSS